MTRAILGLILVVLVSYVLTALVRFYALKKSILDIPNERSSHLVVTPRGGGLAFVTVFLVGLTVLLYIGKIELRPFLALVGGGSMVAVLGWMDDKYGLTPRVRASFHFLAAVGAVFCMGGFSSLDVGFTVAPISWLGSLVAIIGIVWMINLYNFMDGVDGIASIEAVCVALSCGSLLLWQQFSGAAAVSFMLAASVLGFLVWNWPPAKIFMGDVGSGFLGFIFAVMAMWSEQIGAVPFIIWIMLLGVFVVDATMTLIRRLSSGEKLYEAHRTHVYQLAVQVGYSHKQVTLTVLVINIVLAGIAFIAMRWHFWLLPIALTAALALTVIHVWLYRRFTSINTSAEDQETVVQGSVAEAAAVLDE